jgi:hypothetical protein
MQTNRAEAEAEPTQSVKWLYCVYVLKCAATIERT